MRGTRIGACLAATALAYALLNPGSANAAANVAVAIPGSEIAGYATPVLVLAKGAPANFVNADAIAVHDVVSVQKGPDGQPWFKSAVIGVGTTPINIKPNTPAGEYEFFCTIHPGRMRGPAIVQ